MRIFPQNAIRIPIRRRPLNSNVFKTNRRTKKYNSRPYGNPIPVIIHENRKRVVPPTSDVDRGGGEGLGGRKNRQRQTAAAAAADGRRQEGQTRCSSP